MKKQLFFVLFGLLFSVSLTAQLSGKKIFIDPGHGGFTANDRNRATIPYNLGDQSGFWESTANLRKAEHLYNFVIGAGGACSRSRTSTSQDPALSTRCAAANSFGATYYISIHSNAGVAGNASNYLLILWNGTDATPTYSSSRDMANHTWDKMMDNPVTIFTAYTSSRNCRGDRSFLGYNLGALASLTRGGILTEGSFHDYNPEAHRLLSQAYCQMEAYNIYRGICVNQGGGTYANHGSVVGWVKTQKNSQKMTSSYPNANGSRYLPTRAGTHDEWPAVNGALVQLMQNGSEVKRYTVDNNWNGIYGFFNVAPGSYVVRISASGYNCKEANVTVTRGGLASSNHYLTVGTTTCSGGTTPPPDPTVNYILGISSTANAPYTSISNTVVLGTYSNNLVYLSINSGTATSPTWVSRAACNLTSSNTGVATIDASGNITLKTAGTTTITAVNKDNSNAKGTVTLTVNNPTVTPPEPGGPLRLVVGTASSPSGTPPTYGTHVTEIPLSSTRYLGIDKNNSTTNPSWASRTLYDLSSSDASVASIDQWGTITTYSKNGTVVFTAVLKTDATSKGSVSIKVGSGGTTTTNAVRLVAGTASTPSGSPSTYGTHVTTIPVGGERYLGIDKNNDPASPSWVSRTDYVLTTSNANVATVSAYGTIVGITNGTITITAVNKTDGNLKGTLNLTVGAGGANPPVPTPGSLLLNLSSSEVGNTPISGHVEASVQIGTVTYLYIKNHRGDPISRLESALGIDDANIATVDERGKITLKGIGETTIRASYFDDIDTEMTGTLTLKVTPSPQPLTNLILGFSSISSFPYEPVQPSVSVGETIYLTISDGTVTPVQRTDCNLASEDTSVASISAYGAVTGIIVGTTTITATRKDGNKASGTILLFVEGGSTDIVSIPDLKGNAITVYKKGTGINVQFDGDAVIELYTVTGILIEKTQAYQSYSRELDKGVYILRVNGQTIKFVK